MARSIYAPGAYRYFDYKHRLYAVTYVIESEVDQGEVDSFAVGSVIRGCVPRLRGGVVKCNRRSAGLSP